MILGVKDVATSGNLSNLWLPYTLGMLVSMVVTYYSIKWFKKLLEEGKLIYFVYYCLVVGILTILFL